MSAAVPLAKDMLGMNENTLPAWIEPNTVVCSAVENWNVPCSHYNTSREPYQNTSTITKNDVACVVA